LKLICQSEPEEGPHSCCQYIRLSCIIQSDKQFTNAEKKDNGSTALYSYFMHLTTASHNHQLQTTQADEQDKENDELFYEQFLHKVR
jgi:hypothetical protein